MATLYTFLLFFHTLFSFGYAAAIPADNSFTIASYRDVAGADTENALRMVKRQSGANPSVLGRSLYWFGNFSVGDTPDLKLLIDTGSTDLILNKGLYKPSKHKKPYKGHEKFSITYEGVNRAGFGFETINGTVQDDIVTAAGLTVVDQAVGNCTSYQYFDVKRLPFADPGQGIIGFAGPDSSSFRPGARSWFFNLCHNKAISVCKLGLVFGTSGKGLTVVGKFAKNLVKGEMTVVPTLPRQYTVMGDVTVDNVIVARNQTIIMDVGTDNIQGPIKQTKRILDLWGYPTHLSVQTKNQFNPGVPIKVLNGFFPCDKPPTLGFSFPPKGSLKKGQKAQNFNVSPLVWNVYDNGNNNCTSILGGTNALTNPKTGASAWLLGQPFFAGHYVDFDITDGTIGFGNLKDPSMKSA